MKDNKNTKRVLIVSIVTIVLAVAGVIFGIQYNDEDVESIANGIEAVVNIVEENMSTTEIPDNLTQDDEQTLAVQEADVGKNQSFEEQGSIAYKGSSNKTPNITLSSYQGLTYYSQIDSRWANHPYTSIGDNTQTIADYGCGPTCAAMIVSSIKGTITPPEMGDLFVEYGYESAYNGTYWSAFKWTADVFDLDGYSQFSSVDTAVSKLKNNHYLVAICGEGLFTYGGHYIVITGIDGNTLSIYDPYLYTGKFTTASRKAANVTVKGNTVYVSVDNFKKYANCKSFFSYKYDHSKTANTSTTKTVTTTSSPTSNVKNVSYKAKVTAKEGLNIRSGAGTSYSKVGTYTYNTTVTITKESGNWGKTDNGWICLDYVSKISESSSSANTNSSIRVGNTVTLSSSATKYATGQTIPSKYKNKKYTAMQVSNGKVLLKELYSWVYTKDLTTSTASTSSTKTMTVIAKAGLNVRSGPGTNYKIITAYLYNTKVTVYSTTGNWAKVDKGYMCLDYLK